MVSRAGIAISLLVAAALGALALAVLIAGSSASVKPGSP
jgi:hypothetical protein